MRGLVLLIKCQLLLPLSSMTTSKYQFPPKNSLKSSLPSIYSARKHKPPEVMNVPSLYLWSGHPVFPTLFHNGGGQPLCLPSSVGFSFSLFPLSYHSSPHFHSSVLFDFLYQESSRFHPLPNFWNSPF